MIDWYIFNLVFLMILNNLVSMLIEYFFNLLDRKSKVLKYLWYVSVFISLYIWYLLLNFLINNLHNILSIRN